MKKLWIGFGAALALIVALGGMPRANVPCSLPFNLQNATLADATQVMANYNSIITCLANAAAAGANNDITSLNGLTTPITPTQGGSTLYIGGAASGANTITINSTTPSNFSLTAGNQVTFIAVGTNSLPATLNVNSTGAVNVFRRTQLGISATVSGEMIVGQSITVRYDGTQYQLVSSGPTLVGEIRDFSGPTVPPGYLFIDGSCALRATFADLFSVIGTTYDPTGSTCDILHFALPDGRGRTLAGQDTMGINGAANRITNAGSGCTGSTIGGAGCGLQNHVQTVSEMAAHSHSVIDPTHFHLGVLRPSGNTPAGGVTAGANNLVGTNANNSDNAATGISLAFNGSSVAMPILNPIQVVTKIIKY